MKEKIIQLSLRYYGFGGGEFEKNPCSDKEDYRPYLKVYHPNGDLIMLIKYIRKIILKLIILV